MKVKVLACIAVVVVMLVWHNFSLVRVSGHSMSPTIENGSVVLVLKNTKAGRGQIALVSFGNSLVIKRIIGIPGDVVEYRHGLLFINGERIRESYAQGTVTDFSCCLGEDEVFLIGDNRERSTDSRDYGPVLSGKLKGRVLVVG